MQTKENLIKSREEKMSTQTYANTIKELRKKAFDESGLKERYKQKIRDNISEKLGNIILSCFEQRFTDYKKSHISELERLYVVAKEDLKYYFMDKQDLILELELEKSINEHRPDVDDGVDAAKDMEIERLYDEGLIDDDGNIMGNDEEFFEDEENKGSV
jgi:predicted transcriptional regulator